MMQIKYRVTAILSTALLALTMTFSAAATIIPLTATLDGGQAGTTSLATGFATMSYDDSSNDFSWNISWSGLTSNVTVGHFHGPALPTQSAGPALGLILTSNLPTDSTMGSATLTADQASDLLSGMWYINIHTNQSPGGEIRGQVLVPEPSLAFLVLISLSALWFRQNRRAK